MASEAQPQVSAAARQLGLCSVALALQAALLLQMAAGVWPHLQPCPQPSGSCSVSCAHWPASSTYCTKKPNMPVSSFSTARHVLACTAMKQRVTLGTHELGPSPPVAANSLLFKGG